MSEQQDLKEGTELTDAAAKAIDAYLKRTVRRAVAAVAGFLAVIGVIAIPAVKGWVHSVASSIAKQQVDELTKRNDEILSLYKSELAKMAEVARSHEADVEKSIGRLEFVDDRVKQATKDISSLQTGISSLQGNVASLQADVTPLRQQFERVRSQVADAGGALQVINEVSSKKLELAASLAKNDTFIQKVRQAVSESIARDVSDLKKDRDDSYVLLECIGSAANLANEKTDDANKAKGAKRAVDAERQARKRRGELGIADPF